MKLASVQQLAMCLLLTGLASCGGDGARSRIATTFRLFQAPYSSPTAMRQALESKGVVVYAMLCGFEVGLPGTPESTIQFMEATIDRVDLTKALAVGPFTEVTAQDESRRGVQAPCGS